MTLFHKAIYALINYACQVLFALSLLKRRSFIGLFFRGDALGFVQGRSAEIGTNVRIGKNSWLSVLRGAKLIIGNNTHINRDFVVACSNSIEIGHNVLIADRVFITDTDHGYEDISLPIIEQPMTAGEPVKIEDDCWLGINACILKGVTVGRHSVVGAGSVVTRDVPPYSVVCGNPARIIRQYDIFRKTWVSQ